MSNPTVKISPNRQLVAGDRATVQSDEEVVRAPMTRKQITASHPTWCPGCGDFAVLNTYYKLIEKRGLHQEKIVTIAGIGCSSRIPYFVQAHGVHYIHGRALPLATGISLSRPDLHVVVFSGDGDAFSIGGNHFSHAARKNIKLTLVVMDNQVYGLTKKQTSPTSPLGFRSKTDTWGAVDHPVNPIKQAIAAGATFVSRTLATNPNHLAEVMNSALDHDGFSFVHCLSECVEFHKGAFDSANPRKTGVFETVSSTHDVSDEIAAYKCANADFPGYFGIFYQTNRLTKNKLETDIITASKRQVREMKDWEILATSLNKLK